jgi:hypothetical protein
MRTSLYKWLFVFFFFIVSSSFVTNKYLHPYFVTVTEIQHNKKEKILEISCKIFTDDFEKTLRSNYKTHVDLLNPKDQSKMDKLVTDYIRKHLRIIVNGKILQLQFAGYENEEEAIWCYFQVKNIAAVKKIEVNDDLLFEYKKEQINLLHITVNGKRKSTKLNNPESKASFTWYN